MASTLCRRPLRSIHTLLLADVQKALRARPRNRQLLVLSSKFPQLLRTAPLVFFPRLERAHLAVEVLDQLLESLHVL